MHSSLSKGWEKSGELIPDYFLICRECSEQRGKRDAWDESSLGNLGDSCSFCGKQRPLRDVFISRRIQH